MMCKSKFRTTVYRKLDYIMATLTQILAAIREWGTSWKDVALAERAAKETAVAGLTAAQEALSAKQSELDAFLADDAATDAEQVIAAQASQAGTDADEAQRVLDEVLAADQPEEPSEEPPADEEPTE